MVCCRGQILRWHLILVVVFLLPLFSCRLFWSIVRSSKNSVLFLDEVESAARPGAVSGGIYPSSKHILSMIPEGAEENTAELVSQISANLITQLLESSYSVYICGASGNDLIPLQE